MDFSNFNELSNTLIQNTMDTGSPIVNPIPATKPEYNQPASNDEQTQTKNDKFLLYTLIG